MKSNQLLLVNPWIYDFAAYDFWIKPVGLLAVGNYLEKHGYQTTLIDCLDRFHPLILKPVNTKMGTGKFIRTVVEKPALLKTFPRKYCRYGLPLQLFDAALAQAPKPDVILVTSGMTYWYPGVQFAISRLKQQFADTPIILGGIYATLCYEHAVEFSGADFVIRGPGEVAAFNLINSLTGKPGADLKTEVDFPEPSYHYYHKLISTPIISSIGCPFQCSFCASGLLSGRFRQRKPEIVVDEVAHYYFKRRVRHFAFFDDALLVNQQNHISLILQEIIDRNLRLNLHTPNGIHPREITEELAQKMFRSNFKTLRLSFETINKSRQQEMGNKVSEQALICALNYLEKAGYRRKEIDVYVMMGLPDQSVDEVVESMLFVVSLGAKVRLTSFSPIPGTRDWDRSIKQCNLADDLDPLLTNNSIYPLNRPDFPMETFQQLRNLSKALNYGLDQGINFFDNSELVGRFLKYLQKKGQSH